MKVIFDNNIWISFLIGKRLSVMRHVFNRHDIEVCFCDELEHEFLEVAHRPKILKYVDEKQIERVHQLMIISCHREKTIKLSTTPVRDPKDVYLLALCDAIQADYLISGDADLLDLKNYNQTKIVDFDSTIRFLV